MLVAYRGEILEIGINTKLVLLTLDDFESFIKEQKTLAKSKERILTPEPLK